jgi:hypothetical protein
MRSIQRESTVEGATIVALGSFNPAIFQPYWFLEHQLLPKEEVDEADVEIVHRDATSFQAVWFSFQATHQRIAIETRDASKFHPLRDLVSGIFQILEHTPVGALGLNVLRHVRIVDSEEFRVYLDRVAPASFWNRAVPSATPRTIEVRGTPTTGEASRLEIRLEPRLRVDAESEITIRVNQHYPFVGEDGIPLRSADRLLSVLADDWNSFLNSTSAMIDALLEYEVDR